ncbi:uncharacterized protein LOC129005101 [Macrosteles quadrilineatus]|uniref:uncharacterized protein LOC129005101 n=1 Tax=Macrosteles quadrilineatus TaxID=74068 RepID=UPI0023E14C26|nr:uncharacterized protein LOC129005101 [Macrosteles quadrilineatus]
MTNNEIHTSDLEGKGVRKDVFSSLGSVRNIAMDPSVQRLYLLVAGGAQESWRLVSCRYDGSNLHTFTDTPSVIYGLGGFQDRVFWIPHEEKSSVWLGNDDYQYTFSIYTINSTNHSNYSKPSLMLSFSEHVWNLRVYHEDLQTPKRQQLK